MLQVARLSPKLLGESADRVTAFLRSQINPDGGFRDRAGNSDLYYTVFGIEGLLALRADLPAAGIAAFLDSFGDGQALDFVHFCCLARCRASLSRIVGVGHAPPSVSTVQSFRTPDGGYNASPNSDRGTLYACFLAMGAYQDMGLSMPDPQAMLKCIDHLKTDDGGYANQREMPIGLTPSTAAAATLLRHLGHPPAPSLGQWLLGRCRKDGGFFATPLAPIPDLLSTATALHALSGMNVDFSHLKEPCLDFLDSLWTSQGAFFGSWSDEEMDCEYTYYALLALGHLSL